MEYTTPGNTGLIVSTVCRLLKLVSMESSTCKKITDGRLSVCDNKTWRFIPALVQPTVGKLSTQ